MFHLIKTKKDILDYVAKYAKKHHITEEEAKEHIMCILYSKYIKEDKK